LEYNNTASKTFWKSNRTIPPKGQIVPVTLKEIAKRTGRSVTTVSRALNDYDDVSPRTKELVRKVAAEMGYTPSSLAQRLQKQRSETIGLILPTFGPRFSDPYFSELLAGIGNKATGLGYDLLVSTQPPGERELDAYKKLLDGRRVDGFILVRTRRKDARIDYLTHRGAPFTAFGRTEGEVDFPYVDEDGAYGLRLVAEHLTQNGHKHIACISSSPELTFTAHRMEGLQAGLAQAGVSLSDGNIRYGDLTQRSGYKQAEDLLSSSQPITAIVAFNDLMAFGAMSAVQEHGMTVGKDIAVTGFDDIPMAEYSHPPLTTVQQPVYRIGSVVCEMLINLILGKSIDERQIILKPSLVVRQSSSSQAAQIPVPRR
jgi:LacI family transcriptional regulator